MEKRHQERLKQQETTHQEEMSAILSAVQMQLDSSTESLDRRLKQSQQTIQLMIKSSHEAIFAKMEDLTKVIAEIGKQVIRMDNNSNRDQDMNDPPAKITPQKAERPDFETPGNQAKKKKALTRNAANPLKATIQDM